MAALDILRETGSRSDHRSVEPAFEERDVTSILNGVFYMNGHLADIARDIHVIRLLLEDDDGEEEEEEESDGGDQPHS